MDAFNALRAHLEANFSALPLYWPNDSRDPAGETDGWVYSEARVQDEAPVSIGYDTTRRHRETGVYDVFVYVPKGSLTGTAEAHAKTIRDLFGITSVAGVTVTRRIVGIGRPVSGPNGGWYAVPVSISWFADRTE